MQPEEAVTKLVNWLGRKRLKVTQQRRLITEVFFDPIHRETHPTVEELFLRVRDREPGIGYATVYRTLKLLVDSGLATPSRLGDNQTRYEPDIPGEHHDHLVCVRCNAVIEFEDERIEELQHEIARRFGFELSDHRMVLYGEPTHGGHVCDPADLERPGPR